MNPTTKSPALQGLTKVPVYPLPGQLVPPEGWDETLGIPRDVNEFENASLRTRSHNPALAGLFAAAKRQ